MRPLTRLEDQYPELFHALIQAPEECRRRAGFYACRAALDNRASDDELAYSILAKLESGASVSESEVKAIAAHAENLDEHYWNIRHAFEREGKGTLDGYQIEFERFLAVTSVVDLARDRTDRGIAEALYDSEAATCMLTEVEQRILAILRGE